MLSRLRPPGLEHLLSKLAGRRENLVAASAYRVEIGCNAVGRNSRNGTPEESRRNELDLLRREISILRAELERIMSEEAPPEEEPIYEPPAHLAGSSPIRWIEGDWVQSESQDPAWQQWEDEAPSYESVPETEAEEEAPAVGIPIDFFREWREEQKSSIEQLALEMATLSSEVRRLRLELGNGHRANDVGTPSNGYGAYEEPASETAPMGPRLSPIVPAAENARLLQIVTRVAAIFVTIAVCGGALYFLFS